MYKQQTKNVYKDNVLDFNYLFKRNKKKSIIHFFLSTILTIALAFTRKISVEFFYGNPNERSFENNKLLLKKMIFFLPTKTFNNLFDFLGNALIIKIILFVICLFIIHEIILNFVETLFEKVIRIDSREQITNLIITKFKEFDIEDRENNKEQFNNIISSDARIVSYNWEHLPNHAWHSFLNIVFNFWNYKKELKLINYKHWISFSIFLVVFVAIEFWFVKKISQKEKEEKEMNDNMLFSISKERENSVLIESMGIDKEVCLNIKKSIIEHKVKNKSLSLLKTVDEHISYFIRKIFYISTLIIIGVSKEKMLIADFFDSATNKTIDLFNVALEYKDYKISSDRINNFIKLAKPINPKELRDRIILDKNTKFKEIKFEKISFKYKTQKELLFNRYDKRFISGSLNNLEGKNGTGKSTITLILLGLLKPISGNIKITTEKNQKFNLNNINLAEWRRNNIAFISHKNLVTEGSTGQRQWKNIEETLRKKKDAGIIILDESDNALDKEHKEKLDKLIENKLKENIIVILIRHHSA